MKEWWNDPDDNPYADMPMVCRPAYWHEQSRHCSNAFLKKYVIGVVLFLAVVIPFGLWMYGG